MGTRSSNPARFRISAGFFCAALVFTAEAQAQIAKVPSDDGRILFVNAEPAPALKISSRRSFKPIAPSAALSAAPSPKLSSFGQDIYLPSETSILTGKNRPAMSLDRDGAEKLVREAAERHRVDPALVRAVIETESNWNPSAVSRKGAVGLMQLIPTTAMRFGVNDVYSPKQNVDAGVKYLKTLLERYRGNLDLALAAYNAGEGAVDRAHGVPSFQETQSYVRKVQDAYYRPGSGRMDEAYTRSSRIHRQVDANGRIIFTNE